MGRCIVPHLHLKEESEYSMFTDPVVLAFNAVNKSLVRINQDGYSSEYLLKNSADEYRFTIRNTSYVDKKRQVSIDRHTVQVIHTVYPVAPAILSTVRKTYMVIENQQGDTIAETGYVARALCDYLTTARIVQLTNFES